MLNQTRYFTTARKELNSILDFITEALASSGLDPKACGRTRFRAEDLAVMLMDHASEGSRLKVTVRKTLGTTTVRMVCGGTEFNYQEALKDLFADALDEETKILVYEKLLKHYEQDVIVTRKGNLNVVTITAARRKKNQMLIAAATVLLGIAAGLAVKLIFPENTALYVAEHIFGTGTRLFLNAIKMVVPFLVFFSIASGISGFGDLRDLGRIFFRVNGLFTATSVITMLITYGIYRLIPLGHTDLKAVADTSMQVETMDPAAGSLSEILSGIIPANFLQAFLDMNMMQLLFLAMLFVNVYLLSVAAPSVPGGILLCLTALLPQFGIPVSGVTIIIGLYFLVSMMQTMTNVTSTAVCTYIVDRWEKTGYIIHAENNINKA